MSLFNPKIQSFYNHLEMNNSALNPEISKVILDTLVEQQAFMLSINNLAWMSGWLCLALIPILFLCKPVKSHTQMTQATAH